MLFQNILTSPSHSQQQSSFSDVLYAVHGHKIMAGNIRRVLGGTKRGCVNSSASSYKKGERSYGHGNESSHFIVGGEMLLS
jgi:hypothetical protein